jgi:hypothetical protein
MLNNLTNFFNLIVGRRIKTKLEDSDLIAVGTKQSPALGDYKPTAITFADLQSQLGGFSEGCLPQFNFKEGSVGPKVSFIKKAGTDPTTNKDVIIPGQLEITRGNGGGIYNIAQETSYNNVSPINTTWNTQYVDSTNTSWASLWDIENRTYTTWVDGVDTNWYNAPPQYVGIPTIMKWDNGVDEPRYWLIMFTQWGVGAYGEQGSFAYDRYEILEGVYVEQLASSNPNTPQVIDIISDGVHITRRYTIVDNGSYQDSIYNIVSEPFAVGGGVSPRNTKWNSIFTDARPNYSGYNDLSNLESRVYVDFIGALDGDFNNILSTELIMHDMTTDLYHKVQFTDWSEACNLPTGAVIGYNVINNGSGYPDAGVSLNPFLILTAEGGSGSDYQIELASSGGVVIQVYQYNGGQNYQVGDILTFPYPGVTDVYTIEITAVADVCISGGFAYTRTVIPQSCGIKFADGTVMNTAVSGSGGSGVQSVTGLNTDNTDPLNPVVEISVDNLTITGDGTPGNPLVSAGLPTWIETNATDLTVWCNGQANGSTNLAYGEKAFRSNTSGSNNIAIGYSALELNTDGYQNTAIGIKALGVTITGSTNNVAIGDSSMSLFTEGSNNTAVGSEAMYNTSAYVVGNTGIGYRALYSNATYNNTAIGANAMVLTTTGDANTAVGEGTMYFNTTGFSNSAVGSNALRFNTTGAYNSVLGTEALFTNGIGSNNAAVGYRALRSNTSGVNNTAIGSTSMQFNTTGQNNAAVGYSSLYNNTTGSSNAAFGVSSMTGNTTGIENSAFGRSSLQNNLSGSNNTAVGNAAVLSNSTGSRNTGIGDSALSNSTAANNNTAVGYRALRFNTANSNTAIGTNSLGGNTTGTNNTALGDGTNSGDFSGSVILGKDATASASNQFVVGSAATNAGAVTTETITPNATWTVRINGVNYKIPLLAI